MRQTEMPGFCELLPGSHIDAEQAEFLMAMDRYKRKNRRPFPTWCEVLQVVKSLGYEKVRKTEPREQPREVRGEG